MIDVVKNLKITNTRTPHRILHAILPRSEEHTSELQSQSNLVCRLLLEKKKNFTHDRIGHWEQFTWYTQRYVTVKVINDWSEGADRAQDRALCGVELCSRVVKVDGVVIV